METFKEYLNEMAIVNKNDKILNPHSYKIEVHSNDRPHFHFRKSDDSFLIKIDFKTFNIDEVFIDGKKITKIDQDTFWKDYSLSKEYKLLQKWLKANNTINKKLTNLESIIFVWNTMN